MQRTHGNQEKIWCVLRKKQDFGNPKFNRLVTLALLCHRPVLFSFFPLFSPSCSLFFSPFLTWKCIWQKYPSDDCIQQIFLRPNRCTNSGLNLLLALTTAADSWLGSLSFALLLFHPSTPPRPENISKMQVPPCHSCFPVSEDTVPTMKSGPFSLALPALQAWLQPHRASGPYGSLLLVHQESLVSLSFLHPPDCSPHIHPSLQHLLLYFLPSPTELIIPNLGHFLELAYSVIFYSSHTGVIQLQQLDGNSIREKSVPFPF